jgi:hypothetical protein
LLEVALEGCAYVQRELVTAAQIKKHNTPGPPNRDTEVLAGFFALLYCRIGADPGILPRVPAWNAETDRETQELEAGMYTRVAMHRLDGLAVDLSTWHTMCRRDERVDVHLRPPASCRLPYLTNVIILHLSRLVFFIMAI